VAHAVGEESSQTLKEKLKFLSHDDLVSYPIIKKKLMPYGKV
jgi:hypothetical protein